MCWKCGKTLNFIPPISRTDVCLSCRADVRSCRNCSHYSKGLYNDCYETVNEPVLDKERANFCEWFSLNPRVGTHTGLVDGKIVAEKSAEAKKNFENLFGD